MKLALLALSLVASTSAFQIAKPLPSRIPTTGLRSTVEESSPSIDVSTTLAKTELLETAKSLHDEFGCLIIDSKAQEKLREAVEKLEGVTEPPTESAGLIGNWTLLCSTASASLQNGPLDKINGIDTSKLPFFNEGPLKEIRDTINKSLKVQQVIKAETTPGVIDRVDHVLQYVPPSTLADFVAGIPDTLKNLNINPLQVSQSKVILVHKAETDKDSPSVNTKLSLSSIIGRCSSSFLFLVLCSSAMANSSVVILCSVNVAGKSQVLDPNGADIVGINVPFGEFLNAGAFETTYMDDKIRVSRSKVGIVDQLRVFLKSDLEATAADFATEEEEKDDEITDVDIIVDTTEGDDVSPSDY